MGLLVAGDSTASYRSVDRTNFTATAGQTTFTLSQGYSIGDIDVYLNGVKLVEGDDFYALNGTTVVLTSGAVAGDIVAIVAYNTFLAANTYTKTEADSRYMVASGLTPMTSYLRTPNYGISSWSDSANASLEASVGAGEQGVGVKAFGRSVATNGGDILYTTDNRGAGGRHRFGYWNGTSFTSTMSVDSVGRLSVPNQPFSWYTTLNTIAQTGSAVVPLYTSKAQGRGSDGYSSSTGLYTAPVAGVYDFKWVYLYQNILDTAQIDDGWQLNGNYYYGGNRYNAGDYAFNDGYSAVQGFATVYMSQGDTFSPKTQMSGDSSWNFYGGSTWGYFQAALIN